MTDHSALKTLMTNQTPKGRRARWIMELQQYDFKIEHRQEKVTQMQMPYQDYKIKLNQEKKTIIWHDVAI